MPKEELTEPLDFNLHITSIRGCPALQFRKTITLCPKNAEFLSKIISVNFSKNAQDIFVPVRVKFRDPFRAKQQLETLAKECGIKIDLGEN